MIARHDYLPFGQEIPGGDAGRTTQWGAIDGVTQKFTGQEHDVETALDFFQARYHANQQGRFLSADPGQAGADITNPQSWNGYGYVLNSPIVNTDPDGTDTFDPDPIGDPCDDDPSCGWGWGGGFPPIGPGGNPQPPPPPPPPPAVSTGGLNVPNSGVYGQQGWGNGFLQATLAGGLCIGPQWPVCVVGGAIVIGGVAISIYGPHIGPEIRINPSDGDYHYSGPQVLLQNPAITLMGKVQGNEWNDWALEQVRLKKFANVCDALGSALSLAKDPQIKKKIVQAQKFAGCRNAAKRAQ